MAKLLPFRGLRYNTDKVDDLSAVTAPPYDVIDEDFQQALYDKHAANCVRLILNQKQESDSGDDNIYTRARDFINQWQEDGLLIGEDTPSYYAYSQTLGDIERKGLIGLLRIEEFESKVVLPHEYTLGQYITDRLNLMKTAEANLSQMFMIYRDPEQTVEKTLFDNAPDAQWDTATDKDGIVHKFRAVSEPDTLKEIETLFENKTLLIADGHHRYETALKLKHEVRQKLKDKEGLDPPEGSLLTDYVSVFVSNMDDPGLKVYPTHRLLKYWPVGWIPEAFEERLFDAFNVVTGTEYDLIYHNLSREKPQKLKLKKPELMGDTIDLMQNLDVVILDKVIFNGIFEIDATTLKKDKILRFDREKSVIDDLVNNKKVVAAFYMKPPSVPLVHDICQRGLRMPQKSTYFYPKILSGLVFYPYGHFNGTNDHALSGTKDGIQVVELPQESLVNA